MRVEALNRVRPICPTCRAAGRPTSPLELGAIFADDSGDVLEGVLQCPAEACMREHPIIDGIPMIVDDIRSYVQNQLGAIARPARVHFISGLPKTRSGKMLRRSIQALAEGRDPGDLTTIDDPSTLEQIRASLAS